MIFDESFIRFLRSVGDSTSKTSEKGALALNHWPRYPMLPFEHILYGAIPLNLIQEQEAITGIPLPPAYRETLQRFGGATLFKRCLNLFSFPFHKDRFGQPISISFGNLHEVPHHMPHYITIVGGFKVSNAENGYIFMAKDGSCGVSPKQSFAPECDAVDLASLIKNLYAEKAFDWGYRS